LYNNSRENKSKLSGYEKLLAFTIAFVIVFSSLVPGISGMLTNVAGTLPDHNDTPRQMGILPMPAGKNIWKGGTFFGIEWKNSEIGMPSDPVDIYYSIDSGITWTMIGQSQTNDGMFSWKLPNLDSNECQLRITNLDGDIWQRICHSP